MQLIDLSFPFTGGLPERLLQFLYGALKARALAVDDCKSVRPAGCYLLELPDDKAGLVVDVRGSRHRPRVLRGLQASAKVGAMPIETLAS